MKDWREAVAMVSQITQVKRQLRMRDIPIERIAFRVTQQEFDMLVAQFKAMQQCVSSALADNPAGELFILGVKVEPTYPG